MQHLLAILIVLLQTREISNTIFIWENYRITFVLRCFVGSVILIVSRKSIFSCQAQSSSSLSFAEHTELALFSSNPATHLHFHPT